MTIPRLLTGFGWFIFALGVCCPIRLVLVISEQRNVYFDNTWVYCAYDVILSALSAGAGYGLVRRRLWAPVVACLAAGATIALSAGSLVVLRLNYVQTVDSIDEWTYCKNYPVYILMNVILLLAWVFGLVLLLRSREFPGNRAGPAVLWGALLVSFALCLTVSGMLWITHQGGRINF